MASLLLEKVRPRVESLPEDALVFQSNRLPLLYKSVKEGLKGQTVDSIIF